jgi:hypothetical protein
MESLELQMLKLRVARENLIFHIKEFVGFQAEVIEMDREVFSEFFASYLDSPPLPNDQINTGKLSFVANQLRYLMDVLEGKFGSGGEEQLVSMLSNELKAGVKAYEKVNAKLTKTKDDLTDQIEEKRHEQQTRRNPL